MFEPRCPYRVPLEAGREAGARDADPLLLGLVDHLHVPENSGDLVIGDGGWRLVGVAINPLRLSNRVGAIDEVTGGGGAHRHDRGHHQRGRREARPREARPPRTHVGTAPHEGRDQRLDETRHHHACTSDL